MPTPELTGVSLQEPSSSAHKPFQEQPLPTPKSFQEPPFSAHRAYAPPRNFPVVPKRSALLGRLDLLHLLSGKRRRAPNSREVAVELSRLEKLTGKLAAQQKRTLECVRDWGAELPEPESRELMSNMFNLLSGPLTVYGELQSRLATIHSHFADLSRKEEQTQRVEGELKATQKLYYKANYRDFPAHQIDSYRVSYETSCAELDELRLRHRNRLVSMIKQAYQVVLQQMLDSQQKQRVCAETGIRFLAAFDAEPREALPEEYVAYSVGIERGAGPERSGDVESASLCGQDMSALSLEGLGESPYSFYNVVSDENAVVGRPDSADEDKDEWVENDWANPVPTPLQTYPTPAPIFSPQTPGAKPVETYPDSTQTHSPTYPAPAQTPIQTYPTPLQTHPTQTQSTRARFTRFSLK